MIDLIQGPPPTMAALVRFDKEWGGNPHTNVCIVIHNGVGQKTISGTPDFLVYYVPKEYTQVTETPGLITVQTDAGVNSVACIGIAK